MLMTLCGYVAVQPSSRLVCRWETGWHLAERQKLILRQGRRRFTYGEPLGPPLQCQWYKCLPDGASSPSFRVKVPFDVPTVSHDMLLRFQNTDFLSAAGAAAKIPSRIGSEQAVVIGHTHPNGTVYTTTPASAQEVSGKSASSAAVRKEDPQGIDNSAAAYYNAGSAVVVLLLLGVVAAIFFTLRKKVRQAQDKQGELGRYEAATFSEPSTPHSASGGEKSRRMAQHKRGLSVTSRSSSQAADDVHELERLVKRDGQANDGSAAVGHSTSLGASRTSVIPEEDVFSLGGDSDEGDPESKSKR